MLQMEGEASEHSGMQRHKKLWYAVLFQALKDMTDVDDRTQARRWLYSLNKEPGSLIWLCDVLDIDPAKVRTAAKRTDRLRDTLKRWDLNGARPRINARMAA